MPVHIMSLVTQLGSQQKLLSEFIRELYPEKSDKWFNQYLRRQSLKDAIHHEFPSSEEFIETAISVSKQAIAQAGLTERDIDAIYVATTGHTEKYFFPDASRFVTFALGDDKACLNVGKGCAGGLQALTTGYHHALARKKPVLVVAGDRTHIGLKERNEQLVFSEGVAAVILGEGPGPLIVSSQHRASKVERKENLLDGYIQNLLDGGDGFFHMRDDEAYRWACRLVWPQIVELVSKEVTDRAYLIPHQSAGKTLDALAHQNDIALDRFYREGFRAITNTSVASTFFGLQDVLRRKLQGNHKEVLLFSYGAGPIVAATHLRLE